MNAKTRALLTEAQAAAKKASAIATAAKSAGRDMTSAEQTAYSAQFEIAQAKKSAFDAAKAVEEAGDDMGRTLLKSLEDNDGDAPEGDDDFGIGRGGRPVTGSKWSRAVMSKMRGSAQAAGVKSVLTGQVSVPSVVEVVALPDRPTSLLDLIERVEQTEGNSYSYLRQVVKTNNADVVADNALKPTSILTFEEQEDRCRVVAHLSEPFPLRYLDDYSQLGSVLDVEMQAGVLETLEEQIASGDGEGENFTGILQTTGVTDVPFATDILTTIRKARTALAAKGETATAWVFNPADLEALDLMRENGANGGFLLDSAAADTVFGPGIERVSSLAVPAGTAILGDFTKVRIRVRQGAHTLAATQAGDLFDKNQVKLRGEGRFGVDVIRPQAFAVVHLTA